MPASKVASPRKVKNPTTSVTIVNMIEDVVGRERSPVKAKHHGIVIEQVTSPPVHRGDDIAHIAELPETVESEGR
ncbi:MAG: hypothetical protein HKN10_19355 [Myxococcales bacterium]|nr:hypothetical protein [Myxococcales bacterium]